MGITPAVAAGLEMARQTYQVSHPTTPLRVVGSEPETLWHKLDHLLYLPILNLTRPRDLYYDQGDGLQALYGFTYKYLTMEHFLGELARLGIGQSLAEQLAQCYSQAWYPGHSALLIFSDWHVKPHWTKFYAHSGHVTMWERVMPGTKQLIVNGAEGHLLGAWNTPVDTHLSHVLVDLEAKLASVLARPIACNICDSEGGGLPLALRYAQAKRDYISVLPRLGDQGLSTYEVQGVWQPVAGDPSHEAVEALWADPERAAADPRRLVLMRPVGCVDPTRVYAGLFPTDLTAGEVPASHRRRWPWQERRIRAMVNGANLNANYGYTYDEVPNRTRRRRWEEAQAQVEITQRKLAERAEALTNLSTRLQNLKQSYVNDQMTLQEAMGTQQAELAKQAGAQTGRWERRLASTRRQLEAVDTRFQRCRRRLIRRLCQHRTRRDQLRCQLAQRLAAQGAIDTQTLCRERRLEKDQIMVNLQVLLTNLHDWACQHYFAADWKGLELKTATCLIYRKRGRVTWYADRVEVLLEPYRYPAQQRAMETTCQRFNATNPRWRDGRLLHLAVAQGP